MSASRSFGKPLDFTSADKEFLDRFWSKVDERGPDECWPWLAYCGTKGYGQFMISQGVFATASRVALATTVPLSVGQVACHRCDNPPCCNPAHLFVGTQSDNALDMVAKGRANRARGVAQASAKLTEDDVRQIRAHEYRRGLYNELGRQYGVAGKTIRTIRDRTKWSHVA